jgi:uncharacterized membrane protein YfcA
MAITIISLVILGFAVGTFGTLVGIGGGIILVPLFLLLLHYTPQHAIGTSLAVVFFNALSGTYAYIEQKKVFYDAGIRFSLATIPGAVIGSYLANYFTSKTFNITFGVLLLCLAVLMFYRSARKQVPEKPFNKDDFQYNRPLGVVLSVGVGFLSSILGIGGGIIHVPILVYLLGFPTHVATATSHFVLAISSFFGVASHLLLGNILVVPALAIGAGAAIGAQVGAKLSLKMKSRPILILLSLSMAALGLRLALS